MNAATLRRSLVDLRWQVFWYGVGLACYAALVVWLFPSFRDALQDAEYPEELLEFFGGAGNLTDPATFLTTEYFSFAPLILIIYGVVVGTGLLAGDEGRGTLDTLLAQPVRRTSVLVSRFAGAVAGALGVCVLITVGWAVSLPFVDIGPGVSLLELVAVTFVGVIVVAFFIATPMLLGAIAPSRGLAAGIMTAVVVASYLVASFARTIDALAPLQYASAYYYSDAARALTDGIVWWHQLVLFAGTGVALALTVLAFEGRELGVGTWQSGAVGRGWGRLASRTA